MPHRTRAEQRGFKVQKDRKKRAKQTQTHLPKVIYTRKPRNHQEFINETFD